MKCPKCGSNDNYADGTYNGVQSIRRDRHCKSCGHIWRTLEVAEELVPKERSIPCQGGCGKIVTSKHGRKKFCDDCLKARIKEQNSQQHAKKQREADKKQKRVSRIPEISAQAKAKNTSYGLIQAAEYLETCRIIL